MTNPRPAFPIDSEYPLDQVDLAFLTPLIGGESRRPIYAESNCANLRDLQ